MLHLVEELFALTDAPGVMLERDDDFPPEAEFAAELRAIADAGLAGAAGISLRRTRGRAVAQAWPATWLRRPRRRLLVVARLPVIGAVHRSVPRRGRRAA